MRTTSLIGIALITLLSGCASNVAPFSTNAENAWFLEHRAASNSTYAIYCMANKKESKAEPKCYTAETIDPPSKETTSSTQSKANQY